MCASVAVSGMPSIYRFHVCVDLSLDLYGRLIQIGFIDGCKFFNGVSGRTKCPVAPASAISFLFFIFVIDVEYDVSVLLGVQLLMIVISSSTSSSFLVASRANLFLILCWVGYNEFTEFGSRFCLSILYVLDPIASNRHPRHCCYCCFCFQVSYWYITQFALRDFCDRIHTFPSSEPSGRFFYCDLIDAPAMVCASSRLTLGVCVLFWLLGWYCHPLWSTSYPHDQKYKRLTFLLP